MSLVNLAAVGVLLSTSAPDRTSPGAPEPLVVTTAWLARHLGDKDLVLFQVGDRNSRPAYDEGHIPGAQFLNPSAEISAPRTEGALSLELPPPALLDSVLESKGISNTSRVVVYWAREYFSPTSRAVFTLEYAGLAGRVSVLDGGLEQWKREGRPVSTDIPAPARGNFTVRLNPSLVADAEFVKSHLDDRKVRIVDARDSSFFNGRETRQGRNGHIPGAVNIPFSTMVDSLSRLQPATVLDARFAAAGVARGQTVVTYCHIGQQASLVWFAARLLGYDARVYDGSFEDWARRTELPVATPATRPD